MSGSGKQAMRLVILGLSVVSIALGGTMVGHCKFIEADTGDYGYFDEVYVGLYSVENPFTGDCEEYPDGADFETSHKASRAFGVITVTFTGIAMLLVLSLLTFLNGAQKPLWTLVRILFAASLLFQCATFVIFELCSDGTDCLPGVAAIIGAVNALILLVLSVLVCNVPAPEKAGCGEGGRADEEAGVATTQKAYEPREEPMQQVPVQSNVETIKIEIVEGPNGEKVTIKEVTHADGTKTITETTEESVEQYEKHHSMPGRYGSGGY